MSLATQSLKLTSIEAARLWRSLQQAKDTDEIDSLLQSLWQVQNNQELATDIMADLADQIDAEIAALKARIEHLVTLHQNAINKLESWRSRLDQTVINLNEQGVLNNEIAGQLRRITIKDNPPTCSILVEPEQLLSVNSQQSTVNSDAPDDWWLMTVDWWLMTEASDTLLDGSLGRQKTTF